MEMPYGFQPRVVTAPWPPLQIEETAVPALRRRGDHDVEQANANRYIWVMKYLLGIVGIALALAFANEHPYIAGSIFGIIALVYFFFVGIESSTNA
jgi:hypothetical protein